MSKYIHGGQNILFVSAVCELDDIIKAEFSPFLWL